VSARFNLIPALKSAAPTTAAAATATASTMAPTSTCATLETQALDTFETHLANGPLLKSRYL